jgi:2,6-dihydroxypseudooxynicotine hydrolase
VLRESSDWTEWGEGLARRAAEYEQAGNLEAERRHIQSAIWFWRTAASCFHYAQIKWPHSQEKMRLQAHSRNVFGRLRPVVDPPAEPVAIAFDGITMPGYVRLRPGAPTVLLINGLDSAKEVELFAFGSGFVDRGLSVACIDLPGLGELNGVGSLHCFDEGLECVLDWLRSRCGVNTPTGVFGVSFGGHLACRAAAKSEKIDAGICLGGFFNFEPMRRLPAPAAANLRRAYNLASEAPLEDLCSTIDLEPLRGRVRTALLLIHGTKDHLVDLDQVEQIRGWAPQSRMLVFDGAEHVCTDRFAECLPALWDFMADALSDRRQRAPS